MNPPDLKKLGKALEKYKFVALVLCAGLLLMLLPSKTSLARTAPVSEPEPEAEASDGAGFDLAELETKLSLALEEINGVGEATVILSVSSSAESVLAQDVSEGNTSDLETVIVSTGSNTEQPVSIKTIYPEFRGAVVICDGAGNAGVKLEVLHAVSAITGLSSNQISVCQRK